MDRNVHNRMVGRGIQDPVYRAFDESSKCNCKDCAGVDIPFERYTRVPSLFSSQTVSS